ncbi:serine--tRNA ligase [Candidatus Woesearchaeota archaeon]|nr:serine--tRNA ligase [Candidatus Woesearchaeota archaeon]
MLDINLIRDHQEIVKKGLEKRNLQDRIPWVAEIRELDAEWKNLKQQVDDLRHLRNKLSLEISQLKKEKKDATAILKQATDIPKRIAEKEARQNEIWKQIEGKLWALPNILHNSVPYGTTEENNKVEAVFGKKPKFTFEPKSHVDLIEQLAIADVERAAKISGARFWFTKGALTQLDFALQHYAINFMIKNGYTLLQPPFMMNRKSYEGVIALGDFEEVMYKIEGEDLYMIATSEHPMAAMFQDEILDADKLPIKFCGISACFRKEAGAHGKDTKGIFRGHQFNKVEQFIVCKPEDSWQYYDELVRNAVEFWNSLGLHFRKVVLCSGDTGKVMAKTIDLEAWFPSQNAYREVVSCSNAADYQARRLRIRYKTGEGNKLVHTLNATCVATSRALVALLEQNQQKDGSITIPKVLQPYMNGIKKIAPMQKSEGTKKKTVKATPKKKTKKNKKEVKN